MSYENNCVRFPLYVPSIPDDGNVYTLIDFLSTHNPNSFKNSPTHCKP